MTCHGCKTEDLRVTEMRICWCQAELCATCLETHTKTCTAYARPAACAVQDDTILRPRGLPKLRPQKGGFEAVLSVMKRMKRRR